MQFIDLKSRHQLIGDKINARVQQVMDHGQFILGPEVREVEEKLAQYTGSKHCVTVSSGTDSLLISLMALGIGAGDEVITVPYTWISTAEVISLLGAKPVFVDIRPDTWNMDETLLEAAITEKTKAIMPVSIYGQCSDMDAINAIAEKYNLNFAQMSIKFLEIQPFVTSVIIGATTMEQLKTNIESVNVDLTNEIIKEINAIQTLYPNPCP